jgi:hypothetical protein
VDPDVLSAFAELAADRAPGAPLGAASAWARLPPLPAPSAPLDGPLPPEALVGDLELIDLLTGDADRLTRARVALGLRLQPGLEARLAALRAELVDDPPADEAPAAPTAAPALTRAWSRPPGLRPLPAPARLAAATGDPELPPPAEGTLAWAFADGSALFIEAELAPDGGGERALATLMPATDAPARLEGPDGPAFRDADGNLRARLRAGRLRAQVGDELHLLDVAPAGVR